ncbi:MAG: ABC transporter ATP-binding protein [Chloroflexota bacterium]
MDRRRGSMAVSSAPAAVALDGVTCRFGDLTAVDDVSLAFPEGVLVGLVGPSGSGKTTMVRMMRGALSPNDGTVRVFGEDPRKLSGRNRNRLGYMPQLFSLYPDLTAEENVDFVASLYGMLFRRRRRRTRDVLQAVDLWEARGRRASKLSGGMQRRLQLAATLVHDPDLLLLDEPTAGLDPLLRARVWEEVRRLRAEGVTILVTTQYVGEAEECEQVALIVEGRLAALGAPAELRAKAIGGELLVVETSRELSPEQWRSLPEVEAVAPIGPRRARLTVASAARALPALVDQLRSSDTNVIEASEERPSFDDVFATLVQRVRGRDQVAGGAAGASEP